MKLQTILILLAVIAFSYVSQAQNVDEIVNNMIKARGGAEKFDAINTWYTEMEQTSPQLPQPMPMKFWFKKPNKMKVEQEMMGQKITLATNGEKAWMINPMGGSTEAQEVPSEQAMALGQISELFSIELANYKTDGTKLEYVEMADVNGESFHKLKAILSEGNEVFYFIDPISSFIKRTVQTVPTPQGDMEVITKYDEMQKVNGLILPKTINVDVNGTQAQSLTVKVMKLDESIEDSIFDMP